jgi:hypothetical protein
MDKERMSLNAPVNPSSETTRFAAFLAAALVLHALILMLPAQRGSQPGEVLHRLSVSLRAVAPASPEADTDTAQFEPKPTPAARSESPQRPVRPSTPAATVSPPRPMEEVPVPGLSAARLLDLVHRKRWTVPDADDPRRLGAPAREAPRRGSEANNPPAENFEIAVGVEIIDRWLAADGSRNVLMRTPSGHVLCGRTEAWDPMRPLDQGGPGS